VRRRTFLGRFLGGAAAVVPVGRALADASITELQRNWRQLLDPNTTVADASSATLTLSNEEWRRRLEPAQYQVLREEDTERPFSSPLDNEKRPGVFVCVACDLPLFTSAMKFDSGTGWPSFFTTIPGAFETKKDFWLLWPRTEYHCARCGGHHGHLFDDGPPPTGERWCNNGVALRFIARTAAP
jgi:peptide-methionine (R)-S-oxide reductase